MSLGVVIKGSEGLVIAADSRVTLNATVQTGNGTRIHDVNFDNARKVLRFPRQPWIGAVTYGAAIVDYRTAHSLIPEFEITLEEKRYKVKDFAAALSAFFKKRWDNATQKGTDMTFIVAGYDEGKAYGSMFEFQIPSKPKPSPRHGGEQEFGMSWGGQLEIVSRLIHGFDPRLPILLKQELELEENTLADLVKKMQTAFEFSVPWQVLPLQDCVDIAILMIRTTMDAQSLSIAQRGVGGMIEVATITQQLPFTFLQEKTLRGQ